MSVTAIDPINGYIVIDGVAHEIAVAPDGTLKLGTEIGPQEDVPSMSSLPESTPPAT